MAARNAFQGPYQEIVDPLPFGTLVDLDPGNRTFA
jgi:hypothetical protein